MNLDRIIINLRERSAWEAMDLGTRLVATLSKKIFLPWFFCLSVFLILSVYIQISGYPFLGLLVFWLFKPVYDSLLLYIISQELFSEKVSTAQIINNFSVWFWPGIRHSLYLWRLSPMRSFVMPIHNLEKLHSKDRKRRIHILQKNTSGHAVGLTVLAINFELLINLSLYAFLAFMIPDEISSSVWSYLAGSNDESTSGLIMNTVFYGLSVFLVEPLYLASGFMLYLNRRMKLEAWDIEIAFKNIRQRLEHKHSNAIYN